MNERRCLLQSRHERMLTKLLKVCLKGLTLELKHHEEKHRVLVLSLLISTFPLIEHTLSQEWLAVLSQEHALFDELILLLDKSDKFTEVLPFEVECVLVDHYNFFACFHPHGELFDLLECFSLPCLVENALYILHALSPPTSVLPLFEKVGLVNLGRLDNQHMIREPPIDTIVRIRSERRQHLLFEPELIIKPDVRIQVLFIQLELQVHQKGLKHSLTEVVDVLLPAHGSLVVLPLSVSRVLFQDAKVLLNEFLVLEVVDGL